MSDTYEDGLQYSTAQYLDLQGWRWCHVPNEIKAKPQYQVKLNRKGRKSGVPDVLIFERWTTATGAGPGVAIELKAPGKYPTPKQRDWLAALKSRGWSVHVCRTINEVIAACEVIQ